MTSGKKLTIYKVEVGEVYGKLKVESIDGKNALCLCECGNRRLFPFHALVRGNNKSCGCLNHGMAGTRIYVSWTNMKRRCNDSKNKLYHNYGGRGITYHPDWEYFKNFYRDMKDGYDDDLTLDRIDVDGNYCKENCKWSSFEEQMNNMTTSRFVTYKGETLTVSQMARKYGLKPDFVKGRLYSGWSIEDAIEKPVEYEEITYKGVTKTVSDWATEIGFTYHQLKKRLMRGWTVERAIEQPLGKRVKSS